MNVEITMGRDEVNLLSWDEEFLRLFEAYLEEHPEDGELNPDGFYKRFITAHRTLVDGFARVFGDEGHKPFTITIKVGEGPKPKPPGTWSLY